MKKPFSETKVGQFVDKIKPLVGNGLDFVGELTGNKAIEKIGEFLNDKKEEKPELMAAHMEFEKYKLEWELELQRIENEEFKLSIQDKDSARQAEIAMKGTNREWLQPLLALLAVIGFFCCLFYILLRGFRQMSAEESFIVGALISACLTRYGSVYDYYFGSSSGSKRSGEALRKIASEK